MAFGKRWLRDLSRGGQRRRLHSPLWSPQHEKVSLKLVEESFFTGLCVCPGGSYYEEVRTAESRRGRDTSSEVLERGRGAGPTDPLHHSKSDILFARRERKMVSDRLVEKYEVRETSLTGGLHRSQPVYSVRLQCEHTHLSVSCFTQQADIHAMSD